MIKQVGLRIPEELKAWIKEQAQKENRSFNNYIQQIILKEKTRLNDYSTVELMEMDKDSRKKEEKKKLKKLQNFKAQQILRYK